MDRKKIAIYGAGGFGRELAWLAESCEEAYDVVCFVDDDPAKIEKKINGLPVLDMANLKHKFSGIGMAVAIGSSSTRQAVIERLEAAGFHSEDLIHCRTEKSGWIEIERGAVICAGCILTTNIKIGKQVQINLDCTIGHDVILGDYTTLAPGVHVSGWVHFGKRVYVGTGVVFINGTEQSPLIIGDDVVIGAGSCVTQSIRNGTWGGVPAKPLQG
jgi:sugar O-acyltransferase (sialic acid O-acetyltransferase NeuD family)